ncbi:Uncharacterized protein APZ42_016427 [Daphnia magna]|uniref:Uncharacterized protein n=1 Tax=Daphnia magna TaxID=35525 RepID=A0A165AEJ8_9CRUS|nr:Uncharacterized protein APZ42_016427 [Daphnia magna]
MRLLSKTDEDLPLNRSKLSFSLPGDLTAGQEQPQYEACQFLAGPNAAFLCQGCEG